MYRDHTINHDCTLIGAFVGVVSLYLVGSFAWVIGMVALFLMGLHVRWRWTNSLLIAVVIAINTMGSQGMSYVHGGINQLSFVAIGIVYGNVINLLFKPFHEVRSENLLAACEKDVFHLMRTVQRDLEPGVATPYVAFRRTIDRVRDMNKTLQRLNSFQERSELVRLVDVVLRVQRRVVWGQPCHFPFVDAAYRKIEQQFYTHSLPTTHDGLIQQAIEYHLFMI